MIISARKHKKRLTVNGKSFLMELVNGIEPRFALSACGTKIIFAFC